MHYWFFSDSLHGFSLLGESFWTVDSIFPSEPPRQEEDATYISLYMFQGNIGSQLLLSVLCTT